MRTSPWGSTAPASSTCSPRPWRRFIEEQRAIFGVKPTCRALEISPSSYYAARAPPASAARRASAPPLGFDLGDGLAVNARCATVAALLLPGAREDVAPSDPVVQGADAPLW